MAIQRRRGRVQHTPHSRAQQQADRAWQEFERRAGRQLGPEARRKWHDAITGRGLGCEGILRDGLHMFCEGG